MTNTESRPGQMDIARTCGSPPGLPETWATVEAAKLPERWPGQQDVGRVPIENLAAESIRALLGYSIPSASSSCLGAGGFASLALSFSRATRRTKLLKEIVFAFRSSSMGFLIKPGNFA